jgi:hypothetical protein
MQGRPPGRDLNDGVRQAKRFGHQETGEFQILPDHHRRLPGPPDGQHVGQWMLGGSSGEDLPHHERRLLGRGAIDQGPPSFSQHLV